MQELLKKDYIKIGQKIWTKNKKHSAIILDDGNIKNGVGSGSIHKIGAIIKESESCNGWMFWCFENNNKLEFIDKYRIKYRANNHG
jgi:modification methylase